MTTVLAALADNCPLIGRALKDLFATTAKYHLLWHASNLAELFQLLARKPPRLLILDPALSGDGGGLPLVQKLRSLFPGVPLLIYTHSAHQDTAVTSMHLGAAGFLTKDSSENELLTAVQKISGGQTYLDLALMEHLALLQLSPERPHQKATLSVREQQVLEGLASGLPLTAIGGKICCSAKTVSTHRARLLQKLGLHSNAELFRYFQNAPLLQPAPCSHPPC